MIPKERAMERCIRKIAILVLLISLTACFSPFTPIDQDFRPKGKTLAVVAALDSDENIAVAAAMTESLRKNSRYQVMPQRQVAQTLGYPIRIQGPFKSAYFEIETDYKKTDVKRIRSIQQKLGVDYVYAIWTPSSTVYNEKIHSLHAVGQMFERHRGIRFQAYSRKNRHAETVSVQEREGTSLHLARGAGPYRIK